CSSPMWSIMTPGRVAAGSSGAGGRRTPRPRLYKVDSQAGTPACSAARYRITFSPVFFVRTFPADKIGPAEEENMSELQIDLDRSSRVPLSFQVAEQISEAIGRGDLPPGSRLDNEVLLADRLGLSRPTVRQAIQYLVDKGLLVRKRGVGTQV